MATSWLDKLKKLLGIEVESPLPSLASLEDQLVRLKGSYEKLSAEQEAVEKRLQEDQQTLQAAQEKATLAARAVEERRKALDALRKEQKQAMLQASVPLPGQVDEAADVAVEQARRQFEDAIGLAQLDLMQLREQLASCEEDVEEARQEVELVQKLAEDLEHEVDAVEKASAEVLKQRDARALVIYDGPWLQWKPRVEEAKALFEAGEVEIRVEMPEALIELAAKGQESILLAELHDAATRIIREAARPWEEELARSETSWQSDDELEQESAADNFKICFQDALRAREKITAPVTTAVDDILKSRTDSRTDKLVFRVKAVFSMVSAVGSTFTAVTRGVASMGADITAWLQGVKSVVSLVQTIQSLRETVEQAAKTLAEEIKAFQERCATESEAARAAWSIAALLGVPLIKGALSTVEAALKRHSAKLGGLEDRADAACGELNRLLDRGTELEHLYGHALSKKQREELEAVQKAVGALLDQATELGTRMSQQRRLQLDAQALVETYRRGDGKGDKVATRATETALLVLDGQSLARKLPGYAKTAMDAVGTLQSLI